MSLARLEIKPGIVKGEVVAEDLEQKYLLQQQWASDLPKDVKQKIEIKSPRPLISPFSFRMTKGEGFLRLDACSADNKELLLKY